MGAKQTRGEDGLTDLERRFALYYLEEFNATDAYVRASPRKIKRDAAAASAYKLLQKPEVQAFVKAERDRLMKRAELTVEETLDKLRAAMTFDPRRFFNEDGSLKKITELDDDCAAALMGIEVVELYADRENIGQTKKIRFINRLDAVEKAMKYHGLFERDNRQRTDPLMELINHVYGNGSRILPKA